MRNSPLTKTPPVKLAAIPDILNEDVGGSPPQKTKSPEPVVTGEGREGEGVHMCVCLRSTSDMQLV